MKTGYFCLALLVASVASNASAQRGGGGAGFAFGSRGGSFAVHTGGYGFRGARRGSFLYGAPLWWDDSYDDPNASTVPQYLLPPPPAVQTNRLIPPPSPQDPLMIELRGNQYVRVSSTTGFASGDTDRNLIASNSATPTAPATSTLPTVFVFRDGHREESSDYSIFGGMIYARTEYWTDGAWTKPIPIASLNVAESRKANEERGVKFTLPGAPNEVVTRP